MRTLIVIYFMVIAFATNAQVAVPTTEAIAITNTYAYNENTKKFEKSEKENYTFLLRIKGLEKSQNETVEKFKNTSEAIFNFIDKYNAHFNTIKMLVDTYKSLENTIESLAEIQNFVCIENDYLYNDLRANIVNQFNDFNGLMELLKGLFSNKFKAEDNDRFELLISVYEDIKQNEKKIVSVVNAMNQLCAMSISEKEKQKVLNEIFSK